MLSKLLPPLRSALVCTLMLVAATAFAATLNVGPGQPYTTIQSAINAAVNGDTVLVAPGTYYENIDFLGKAITVTSSGGAANTTIDGGGVGSAVSFTNKEPRTAVLSNFTITHGGLNDPTKQLYAGSGVNIYSSSPTILNNIITQNYCQNISVSDDGAAIQGNVVSSSLSASQCFVLNTGGIHIAGTSSNFNSGLHTLILGNTIEKNTTGQSGDGGGDGGPGIAVWGGSPVIQGNIIRNNVTLSGSGGGINIIYGTEVSVIQNLIYGNSAGCGGGGIGSEDGSLSSTTFILIANNTIVGNSGTGNGGYSDCRKTSEVWTAFYTGGGPSIKFVNNIFDANATPALDCGSLQGISFAPIDEAHQSLFDHNLLYDSAGSFFASNCFDTSHLNGNIAVDPQFVNLAAGDFHLKATSPAIDAGNGSVLQDLKNLSGVVLSKDIEGNPREIDATGKGYSIIDMGAYEFGTANGLETPPTRIVLTPSAYYGSAGPISLTATLSSAAGVPTGSVTFSSDGIQLGVANAVNGVATLPNAPFSPGAHVLLATYAGQGSYPPAVSVIVIIYLDKYSPNLTLTSSTNPSQLNSPVTFTVTITSPDNTVLSPITLTDTSTNTVLATLTPNSSGVATFTTSSLPLGYSYITASYAGDTTHNGASASVYQQVISGYNTSTSLSCTPNLINIGASSLCTITVTSANGTPTGSVTLTDGATTLTTLPLTNGTATYTYTGTAAGTHTLAANYPTTGTFNSSSATFSLTVNGLPTTINAAPYPNPSVYGQPVIFTIHVAPVNPTTAIPSGTATLTFCTGQQVTVTLNATGSATYISPTQAGPSTPAGSCFITATYSGDTIFNTSSTGSIGYVIVPAQTALLITPQPNPAYALNTVSLQVSVLGMSPSTIAPGGTVLAPGADLVSGTVTVLDGTTIIATGQPVNRLISFQTSTLAVGQHTLTANYSGDPNLVNKSTTTTVTILPNPTTTALTATPNPAFINQAVTFTANIASSTTQAPIAGGSVTFYDGTTVLGSQTITGAGPATFTTSSLAVGTHPITATFTPAGSAFAASTSTVVNEVIQPSGFTIALSPSTITLGPGASGTSTIQLASVGNFAGPLTLTYGTLPKYATVAITPGTVTLAAGGTATSTLTIGTLLKAADAKPTKPGSHQLPAVFTALSLFAVPFAMRRRKRLTRLLTVILAVIALQTITGCTNSWYTAEFVAAGTYQLPVTATDSNQNSQTATLTVVVTP